MKKKKPAIHESNVLAIKIDDFNVSTTRSGTRRQKIFEYFIPFSFRCLVFLGWERFTVVGGAYDMIREL